MALTFALGQVMADVPEGYATIANMKDKGIPRKKRLLLSASFAIPVLAAAVLSYYVLRELDVIWKMGALSFTAGLLTVAAVEDMLSEAHESSDDNRSSVLAFTGGFVRLRAVHAGFRRAGQLSVSVRGWTGTPNAPEAVTGYRSD